MPLDVKQNAVSIAVFCFFTVSVIAAASGLDPYVCCKKALLGAVAGYLAASFLIKAINAIVTHAMITRKIEYHRNRYARDTE